MEYLPNGFTLDAPNGAFPLSTDSILLSAFVRLPKNARVVDFGAGCGTLGVLLCAEDVNCHVTGIELNEIAHEISQFNGIVIRGLMAIPPAQGDRAEKCKFFLNMSNMFIDIKAKKLDNVNMDILSMGMSGDFEEAILCGSNLVRVGSAIFGPRIYK